MYHINRIKVFKLSKKATFVFLLFLIIDLFYFSFCNLKTIFQVHFNKNNFYHTLVNFLILNNNGIIIYILYKVKSIYYMHFEIHKIN